MMSLHLKHLSSHLSLHSQSHLSETVIVHIVDGGVGI